MKLKDSINYALKKVARNKKNIYFIIILMICTTTITGALYYRKTFLDSINYTITKTLQARSVIIIDTRENYDYSAISNIDHIEEMYNFNYHHAYATSNSFKNDKYTGSITLKYGSEKMLPKNITGKKITSNDTGVAICPKYFYPSDSNKINYFDSNLFLTSDDILNKTLSISKRKETLINEERVEIGIYTENFKIIGTYDPLETEDKLDTCYISPQDMIEIYNETKAALNTSMHTPMYLIVDDVKNVKKVSNELVKAGYIVDSVFLLNSNVINNIKYISNIILIVATFSIIILTILYVDKRHKNNQQKIGTLMSLGFKNKDIKTIDLIETLWITLFSYLLGLAFTGGILVIINIVFRNYLIHNYLIINHSIVPYLIAFIAIVIIPLITGYFYTYKSSNKKIITIIKEEN